MRTQYIGWLSVLVAAALVGGCAAPTAALPDGAVPEGVAASVINLEPGMVSKEAAIAAATEPFAALVSRATVEAHLVSASDPTTVGADKVDSTPLWIVHFAGVAMPISVPGGVPISSAVVRTLKHGYVYIDAFTGAMILSRFEN